MPDDRVHPLASAASVAAEDITRRTFASAFRGYDQAEVRAFLNQVAQEIRSFARREEELLRQIREARDRAAFPKLDEETLTEALGQEAARLLHTAHDAAADIRRKAEENVAKVLRDAHDEAARIRGAAETVLDERTAAAEEAASQIRQAATVEARAVIAAARREADDLMSSTRTQAEAISQEAGELRAKLLGELMRRRRVMHAQVEQLGAGRESLLTAVSGVRRMIEEAEAALVRVEAEAKAEADAAFRRALEEPESIPPELSSLADAPGPAPAPPPIPEAPPSATEEPAPVDTPAATAPPLLTSAPAPSPNAEPAAPGPEVPEPEVPAQTPAEPARPAPPKITVLGGGAATQSRPPTGPGRIARPPAPVGRGPSLVPPPAETPPSDPEGPVSEERRGSSLRILRWGRPEGGRRHPGASSGEHPAVEEGVRIIRPAEPEVSEPAQAEPAAGDEGSLEATADSPAEDGAEAKAAAPSVDELFARIRAERQAALRKAEEVLATSDAPAEGETDAAGAPLTEASADGTVAEPGAGPAEETVAAEEETTFEEPPAPADEEDASEVEALNRRNQLLAPLHERLSRKLKRALQDDQNDVLDRLRSSTRGRPGPVLPEEDEHLGRYAESVSPLVTEAFRAGAGFAGELFADASPAEPKDVSDAARELAG